MRKPASFYFFKRKPIVLKDRYERWRRVAGLLALAIQERLRMEWMVFYYTAGEKNATLTAHHFGISKRRPSTNGSSALRIVSMMSRNWPTNRKLQTI